MKRLFIKGTILSVLHILVITLTSNAQESFLSGFIVTLKFDTIQGEIDYRNWEKNPDEIIFKEISKTELNHFKPGEILCFRVSDEFYKSAIIKGEISSIAVEKLEDNPFPNLRQDTVFLQTLYQGDKSLYYYKNKESRNNFYIESDSGYELLYYKRYVKVYDGIKKIIENKKYIGQLYLYLDECPGFKNEIDKCLYHYEYLHDLFKKYYQCTGKKIDFVKPKEKTKIETGIFFGPSINSVKFKSPFFNPLSFSDFKSSLNFSFGISIKMILPRNQGKWSINNELTFHSYLIEGYGMDYKNANNFSIYWSKIGLQYFNLNNQVCFSQPISKAFLFFTCGISNGISIKETNYLKTEERTYSINNTTEGLALASIRKLEQRMIIGTGVKRNQFSAEIRYLRGNGMSKLTFLNSTSSSFNVLLGYTF